MSGIAERKPVREVRGEQRAWTHLENGVVCTIVLSRCEVLQKRPLAMNGLQWSVCATRYHKIGRKGKLEIAPTKLVGTAADLSVAYSPGVAEPCISISKNPKWAYEYTAKGHLGEPSQTIFGAACLLLQD